MSISNLFGFCGPHIVYDQMLNRFLNVLISIISALFMSSTLPLSEFSYPKLDHHAHLHIVLLLFLFFHLNPLTGLSLINFEVIYSSLQTFLSWACHYTFPLLGLYSISFPWTATINNFALIVDFSCAITRLWSILNAWKVNFPALNYLSYFSGWLGVANMHKYIYVRMYTYICPYKHTHYGKAGV